MSRYVIEIKPEYEDKIRGVMILGAENSNLYLDSMAVDELEELNSDYINEHFSDLQDTAYQQGLDDAWEAARKIADMWTRMGNDEILAFFGITERIGYSTINSLFGKQTANEAMLKLEAYEEKQKADDEIKVGDEVERYIDGSKGIYLNDADEKGDYWNCLFCTGACFVTLGYPKNQFKKTGRHFDIDKIMEAMKK